MDLIKDIFKGDKVIWIIFLFLCLISVVEVFSAASTLTYKSGDHWGPITQHSVILMVGAVIVVLVHNIPCKYFSVLPFFLLPLSCILLLFVMGMGIITGDRVNGAARWMTFFGIQFQPSELAKMAVIIVTAFILSKFQEEEGANPKAFKYIMWIIGIVFILIAPENGSTAALLAGVVFLMMLIGRVPWKQLGRLVGIVGLGLGLLVTVIVVIPPSVYENIPGTHRFSTWQSRIKGFAEDKGAVPAAKVDIDKDAQIAHANIAIATSTVQHDMDTSVLGDPVGLISGINLVKLPADVDASAKLAEAAVSCGLTVETGVIVSGDQFIGDHDKKEWLRSTFGAIACEMEGAAIAHASYLNGIPFIIIRAISDKADDSAEMDYPTFEKAAAEHSALIAEIFPMIFCVPLRAMGVSPV